MKNRATDVLLKCGIPADKTGFVYIVDAMELYQNNGEAFTNMKLAYFRISDIRKKSSEHIMNEISKVFDYAYKNGNRSEVIKYFGLTRRSNGNHLAVLYQRLKEEE